MNLDTLADWIGLLQHRIWECRQACSEAEARIKGCYILTDDFSDLYSDADSQIRQLCKRAQKLTSRALDVAAKAKDATP
jgi:hypothetical protein